jgi:hypothetical protein
MIDYKPHWYQHTYYSYVIILQNRNERNLLSDNKHDKLGEKLSQWNENAVNSSL